MQKKKKNGEAQRYSWECRRRRRMVKPRDIAGNAAAAEEEEDKEEDEEEEDKEEDEEEEEADKGHLTQALQPVCQCFVWFLPLPSFLSFLF